MMQPNEERSKILQMISGYFTAYLLSMALLVREQTILNTILHNMIMREIFHLSMQELNIPDINVSNIISNSREKFVESILDNSSSNYMKLICTIRNPLHDIRESLEQDNLFIQLLFYEKIAKLLKENLENYVNQAESYYEFPMQGTFKKALAYSIFQDVLPEDQDIIESEGLLRELGRSIIDVLNYLLPSVKSVIHAMYEPLQLLQKGFQNSLFRSMPATRFYVTLLTLYYLMDNASRVESQESPASLSFMLHNHKVYRLTYELSLETIKDIILSASQKSVLCTHFCKEMYPSLQHYTGQDFMKIMREITKRINLLLEQRSGNAVNGIKDGIMRVLNDLSSFHYLLNEVELMERNGITEDVIRKIKEEARFDSLNLHNVCGETILYSILKYISSFRKHNRPNKKELDEEISSVRNCMNDQNEFLVFSYVIATLCSGNLPIPHLKANVENNRDNPVIDDVDLLVLSLKPSTSSINSDITSISSSIEPLKLAMYLIEVSASKVKLFLDPESFRGFLIDDGGYLSKKINEYKELYESGDIWNLDFGLNTIFLINIDLDLVSNSKSLKRYSEGRWDVYCISLYPPICILRENYPEIIVADVKEFFDPLLFNWLLWVATSAESYPKLDGINRLLVG